MKLTSMISDRKELLGRLQQRVVKGDADAQFKRGIMYFDNNEFVNAEKYFLKAAEQGHTDAQYRLGVMYEEDRGVLQDDKKAVDWYRNAAEQGHADAQNSLGLMYSAGRGVPQNDVKARKWLDLAASAICKKYPGRVG